MTLTRLTCTLWLVFASCPIWAGDRDNRFLEISGGRDTTIFDLNTVQVIQPGKFTIVSTRVDNPDLTKFELKVLDALRTHCARADGEYPAPTDVFTLGPPDMPVASIEVRSGKRIIADKTYQTKRASWTFPYVKLALNTRRGQEQYPTSFCKNMFQTEEEEYSQTRASIMNGIQSRDLYDCKRGITGHLAGSADPTEAVTRLVRSGSVDSKLYRLVCQAVTHDAPYMPPDEMNVDPSRPFLLP